jgi:hypothetical protein
MYCPLLLTLDWVCCNASEELASMPGICEEK